MRKLRPSRILNEESNFAGVNMNDLMILAVISLVIVYPAIFFDKVFYTVPFIFLIFLFTSVIRQNHRRKFFRDTISFLTEERLVNVANYNRKNKIR